MKALSIKEPYASLIASGLKGIETRSWATSYRGKLYIHASLSKGKIAKEYKGNPACQIATSKGIQMHFGEVIAECDLVDCVRMSESFIDSISETERKCGFYETGRYAWILANVKPCVPIPAKGKLNIWNLDIDNNACV